MDSQDADTASYTNRAITDYTGGSRADFDAFSNFDSQPPNEYGSNDDSNFYVDEPLRLEDFPDAHTSDFSRQNYDPTSSTLLNLNSNINLFSHDSMYEPRLDNPENIDQDADDWQILAKWLKNERGAPLLLEYRKTELENLAQLLQFQIERVEELRDTGDFEKSFESMILQTDVERTKYLIRSYLRTRIQKVENHCSWYATSEDASFNITPTELDFAKSLLGATHKYYGESFLNDIPQQLQALDGLDPEGLSLIPEPNRNAAVFVQILKDIGDYQLVTSGDIIQMQKNNIFITSYRNVSALISSGSAKLI